MSGKKLKIGLFHKDPVCSRAGLTLFPWKSCTNVLVPGFSKNPKYSELSILSYFHFCHLIGWDRSRRKNHIILLFLFACVVVSVRSIPLKLGYLNTWFLIGDAIWGGGTVLLEDVLVLGCESSYLWATSSSFAFVLVGEDVISQLLPGPASKPAACCQCYPTMIESYFPIEP